MRFKIKHYRGLLTIPRSKVMLVPLGRDSWWIHVDLRVRGVEIQCHGGSIPPENSKKRRTNTVFFGWGNKMMVELTLLADKKSEEEIVWLDGVFKDYYEGLIIPASMRTRAINRYFKAMRK